MTFLLDTGTNSGGDFLIPILMPGICHQKISFFLTTWQALDHLLFQYDYPDFSDKKIK